MDMYRMIDQSKHSYHVCLFFLFFFFNDTATTEIYTLSLHDALPISCSPPSRTRPGGRSSRSSHRRSEEHTSELQSRGHLVCRLLLEKKKPNHCRSSTSKKKKNHHTTSNKRGAS